MASPQQALEQLLSAEQAVTLDSSGRHAWQAAATALQAVLGKAPQVGELSARLAMPEELPNEFPEQHLVIPVELSTNEDQQATAYAVLATSIAALFFDSRADNPQDEEQQTVVMVSTIVGQVLQAINSSTFDASPEGLLLSLGDIVADEMPSILAEMEDACLLLSMTVQGGRILPISFVLPGPFLEILAESSIPAGSTPVAGGASESESPSANAMDDARGATQEAGSSPERQQSATSVDGGSQGGPVPISTAPTAQRAQFGPLTEPASTGGRANIDLLSDLQMQISVELGRTQMSVADVLDLGAGSVIELERLAGEPVDILVNNRIIARGEVVVVDENFGVRIVEVLPRSREIGRAS